MTEFIEIKTTNGEHVLLNTNGISHVQPTHDGCSIVMNDRTTFFVVHKYKTIRDCLAIQKPIPVEELL